MSALTRRLNHRERGSALLTAMILTGVLFLFVTALMAYAGQQRSRAIAAARTLRRLSCGEAGLEFAKDYFGRNFTSWNTYLGNPAVYNPVKSYTTWTGYGGPAAYTSAGFQALHPELFTDLDGDGQPDVYIYIRDNADEMPPASNDWRVDNDQNVMVGAVCISQTLRPRRQDGTLDPNLLSVEGLLSYNVQSQYGGQSGGGSGGNGNFNH
jgi:hypothetical protein